MRHFLHFLIVIVVACESSPAETSDLTTSETSDLDPASGVDPAPPAAASPELRADAPAAEVERAPFLGPVHQGIATYYDADGSGNCSFGPSPLDLDVAALSMPKYAMGASCGTCLRVTGPDGEVTVRVVDSCPPCEETGVAIDLSLSAFAKIAEPKRGRIPIQYQEVPCRTEGNVAFHFKNGSSQYWTGILVLNHRIPVAKLEYRRAGTFVTIKREHYNYFVDDLGVGEQPDGLTLRLTAVDGQSFEETIAGPIPSNRTVSSHHQF